MKFLKRHAYALLFTLFLMGANVYSLLKVFVIPSAVSTVSANTTSSSTASSTASTSTGKVTKTDTTYKDDNMDIKITTGKTSDTTYYVADIQLSSADYLKTALAQNMKHWHLLLPVEACPLLVFQNIFQLSCRINLLFLPSPHLSL